MAATDKQLDSLKRSDTLTIRYFLHDTDKVKKDGMEIPIYSLQKSGIVYFDAEAYNAAKQARDKRWSIIMLCTGFLCILRGLTILGSKQATVLGISCAVVIIILRLLNKF